MRVSTQKPNLLVLGVSKGLVDPARYNIIESNNGVDGFRHLLEEPDLFSAIIVGPHLKDIQPLYFVNKINCASSLKTLPILMEGKTGSDAEMSEFIQAGARYYITKKLDQQLINELIDAAVRDNDRYRDMENNVMNHAASAALVDASFKLQTLQEAQSAAVIMAYACPNPRLAAVGITELIINAIEHGNLGIGYEEKTKLYQSKQWLEEIEKRLLLPDNRDKYVTVHFHKEGDIITIRIMDEGKGFNWNKYEELDVDRVFDNHGRGIIMAKNLAFKTMIYHGKGNEVECIIQLL